MLRVDQVDKVEVGRFYLAPTVKHRFGLFVRDWPIIGPLHEDKEVIGLGAYHYHFDFRFLDNDVMNWMIKRFGYEHKFVLSQHSLEDPLQFQPVIYKRRKCRREFNRWPVEMVPWYPALVEKYKDQHLGPAMICPHKGASLKGVQVKDGCVQCPLHGLIWDVKTGEMVS